MSSVFRTCFLLRTVFTWLINAAQRDPVSFFLLRGRDNAVCCEHTVLAGRKAGRNKRHAERTKGGKEDTGTPRRNKEMRIFLLVAPLCVGTAFSHPSRSAYALETRAHSGETFRFTSTRRASGIIRNRCLFYENVLSCRAQPAFQYFARLSFPPRDLFLSRPSIAHPHPRYSLLASSPTAHSLARSKPSVCSASIILTEMIRILFKPVLPHLSRTFVRGVKRRAL